jgi:hypothetical protein
MDIHNIHYEYNVNTKLYVKMEKELMRHLGMTALLVGPIVTPFDEEV